MKIICLFLEYMLDLFSFNWQTNYLFFPIISAFVFSLRYFANNSISDNAKNPFFGSMIMFSSQLIFGSLLYYFQYKTKENQKKPIKKISKVPLDYILNFSCASLDLLSFTTLLFLSEVQPTKPLILRMTQSLFLVFLGIPILHIELFRYHYVSIILTSTVMIIIMLIEGIFSDWTCLVLYLLSYFMNSLRYVLMKKEMQSCFYTAYKELMYQGLIGVFEMFIFIAIGNCFSIERVSFSNMKDAFFNISFRDSNVYLVIFIAGGCFNIINTKINETMSLLHVGITDTIAGLLFIFVKKEKDITTIIDCILIVIIIISCLICTEVIICNFCGLKKDTTNAIIERGKTEHLRLEEIINQDQDQSDED